MRRKLLARRRRRRRARLLVYHTPSRHGSRQPRLLFGAGAVREWLPCAPLSYGADAHGRGLDEGRGSGRTMVAAARSYAAVREGEEAAEGWGLSLGRG